MFLGTKGAECFPLLASVFLFWIITAPPPTVLLISPHAVIINFVYKWHLFRYPGRDFTCVFMNLTRQLFCFQEFEFSHLRNERDLDNP